jgi:hypothetical protein
MTNDTTNQMASQFETARAEVLVAPMHTTTNPAPLALQFGERRRTIVALVSASVISLMVWGLIVALNVH